MGYQLQPFTITNLVMNELVLQKQPSARGTSGPRQGHVDPKQLELQG